MRSTATPVPLGLALAACLLTPALARANELIGCWQAERVTQFLADGRSHVNESGGTIRFTADEVVTRATPARPSEIRYRYAIVRPGVYSATMTFHSRLPEQVGGQREYEYRVDGDLLHITTYPPTTQPAPSGRAVKVQSTSRRVACAG